MAAPQASSRLEMLQARFQQRQLLEKEQKLLQLYDQQQVRAHQVAQRGSAGSNGSNSSSHGNNNSVSHQTVTRTSTSTQSTSNSQGGGKVRQMFDERRQTGAKGIDKSYPLEPLENRSRKHQTTTTSNVSVTSSSSSPLKNGNPTSNRLVTRRTVRSEANSNINNGKPIVTYHEEVSREICDPTDRDNEQEEFGDENNVQVPRYGNGNQPIERPKDLDIEDVTNDNITQRHRTTAKIHLTEFDASNGTNTISDNLENEQFPDEHMIDLPEKLPRRGSNPKKPSEAEARFERFKNTSAKRIGQNTKQIAGNTTSFTKKRNENTVHSGSTSRASTVTRTMEEETSRASSMSPEIEVVERPRFSSPEVPRNETNKILGVTKVSQICHKNTTDYYPRRKSEFEKSKTFRKLQLELGESSPEPNEPEDNSSMVYGKQCKKRNTILDTNIYSSERRDSSSSLTNANETFKGRRESREMSPENLKFRKEFQSPIYRRELIMKDEETTSEGIKTSNLESNIYSSRRRSSSSSPFIDDDCSNARKNSQEKSPERPESRGGSQSPIYRRKSIVKNEETIFESNNYSSRRSSSSSPFVDRNCSNERKTNYEKTLERPGSRQASQSPIHRRKSTVTSQETKRTSGGSKRSSGGSKTSNFESNTYSSRRSSSSSPFIDHRYSKDRKTNHEKTPERTGSRQGSQSPIYRRKSTVTSEETKKTSGGSKTSNFESNIYSSRRSSSTGPFVDRHTSKERKISQEKPPERSNSPGRSQSPVYRRGSTTKNEESKTGMKTSHSESSTYSSRLHSTSPNPNVDRHCLNEREMSHEKSPDRQSSRERSQSPVYRRGSTTKNEESKTGMKTSHLESSTYSSRLHSTSPNPTVDRHCLNEREISHEKSPDRQSSPGRSQSPVYRRGSTTKNEESKTGMKTSHLESSTYSSRLHSTSPNPTVDRHCLNEREMSHEKSPDRQSSRERSQSPVYRRGSTTKKEESKTGMKTSHLESSTYSSRLHSTSPNPTVDRHCLNEREMSHEKSPDRQSSRERSQSPVYRRGSTTRNEESKTGMKTSHLESSTYSSRLHSTSPNPIVDRHCLNEREMSHEKSLDRQSSPGRSQSPVCRRGSTTKNEESKTGMKTSHLESSTYSSRLHSTSPNPTVDRHCLNEREMSHEKSPDRQSSGKTFKTGKKTSHLESSTYSSRLHSTSPNPIVDRHCLNECKMSHEKSPDRQSSGETFKTGMNTSHLESSTYSSRLHSTSPNPTVDRHCLNEREMSQEKSPDRQSSQGRSQSPVYRRGSTTKNEESKTGMKTSHLESSTYSSRLHSTSPNPIVDRHCLNEREMSYEKSPERPSSPGRSQSPIHRKGSTTKNDRRSSNDHKGSIRESRPKSEGTLRSFELVKKLVRPSSSETKITTSTKKSFQRKTTLEDIEFPEKSSNLRDERKRSKSPDHKIVKKDRALMEITTEDKLTKSRETGRKKTRDTRSRTISPSPPSSRTMKETASSRAKKIERKNSIEAKKNESTHQQLKVKEFDEASCEFYLKNRSKSPDDKDSRRLSSEITVKRHDTFKVNRPSRRVIKIDNEKSSVKGENLTIEKKNRPETKDNSELLERIEKIRTTLSRTGRSEQNLQSKEFERTDSVESALRRFDSIGVETEHHVTIGVDETDLLSPKPSSEPFFSTKHETHSKDEKNVATRSIESRSKPTEITLAIVKVQPKKINKKSREPSRETPSRVDLGERHEKIAKSAKTRKEKSITTATTPRRSDDKMAVKSRPGQKRATSIVKRSKLRSEEPSGRGEGKINDLSPLCKRKLFEDSESEIETDNLKSTVLLTTVTRVIKDGPKIVEIETRNNRKNIKDKMENVIFESCHEEKKNENEPTKILRSIEDIRKSIKRESQDFKRELNKFNTVMRRDVENSSKEIPGSIVTSGILSRVQITKTMNSDDRVPVIKIERSTVKLPITHRVAKSPSPDIGTKRSTGGRARITTTTTTVRRNVPSSPAKSPDTNNRYGSSELRIPGTKSLGRTSSSPGPREVRNLTELSTTEYSDCTDGPANDSENIVTEIDASITTKKNNDAFVIELDDNEISPNKEIISSDREKPTFPKQSTERSLTGQKQQKSPSTTPLPRPTSGLSTVSGGSSPRGNQQTSQINSKSKMSAKTKSMNGAKRPPPSARGGPPAATAPSNDGLTPCKICGRHFNSERVTLHEQICAKTATKKRKQFDTTVHRVKGTELEPFVVKKGGSKKPQVDKKNQVKSNWRRKHEDFINAIRSAKQVQAHLAAGGKLSDLPPPPPSDTSDYVQCPHCGRKFNQGAAERHIPKCQTMMHNKPNPRAPPKPKR